MTGEMKALFGVLAIVLLCGSIAFAEFCSQDPSVAISCDAIPPPAPYCGECSTTTGPCDVYSTDTLGYRALNTQSPIYQIPVVWHIVRRVDSTGDLPDSIIANSMETLNEGFRALGHAAGSVDTKIEFVLAGISRIENTTWFDSLGWCYSLIDSIAGTTLFQNPWDPSMYYNIVTMNGIPGSQTNHSSYPWFAANFRHFDATMFQYTNVGTPDNGRILVHETGHLLGLHHLEYMLCSATCTTDCQTTGDLICDTDPYLTCGFSPSCVTPSQACGQTVQDSDNYMMAQGASACMTRFTHHQAGRMRCALETYRSILYLGIVDSSIAAPDTVSAFCYRGNSLMQFTVPWETNIATTDTDTLEIFFPAVSCGSFVSARATASPNGTSHSVTYQGPCTPGTYKYNIRSRKGILGTRSMCRTFVVTSCPSCPQCEDPPCELE